MTYLGPRTGLRLSRACERLASQRAVDFEVWFTKKMVNHRGSWLGFQGGRLVHLPCVRML
jgi:hypothetical protein